jgi:hypothetical protein
MPSKYCPANSKRGQDKAHSIHAGELKALQFFFLNFKGTPSPWFYKTIFSSLKISEMAFSNQIDLPGIFLSPEDDL